MRRMTSILTPILTARWVYTAALIAMCSAYLQGPITKILDFQGAIGEMLHFGLLPAPTFAVFVIVFELSMSVLVIFGIYRWVGAIALAIFTLMASFLALRFWQLPPGMERAMVMNAFFEHLGLTGAFIAVAVRDFTLTLDQNVR
jgi:uncharacterized membrane protein YphA (DoxX/SURF4 family)